MVIKHTASTWLLLLAVPGVPLLSADVQRNGTYQATAYAQTGITASGEWTRRHMVAADPDILPIGSRIKIRRAGRYSGEYVVADTGSKIQGRRLDIYLPSEKACIKFGTRLVKVKVLSLGSGTKASVKEADAVIKENVAKDLQKQAVGNSATQDDWAKSKAATQTQPQPTTTSQSPATNPPPPKTSPPR